jgi:hypothetical protein
MTRWPPRNGYAAGFFAFLAYFEATGGTFTIS